MIGHHALFPPSFLFHYFSRGSQNKTPLQSYGTRQPVNGFMSQHRDLIQDFPNTHYQSVLCLCAVLYHMLSVDPLFLILIDCIILALLSM